MINLENYLDEEWETESLDSVLFNLGYNTNEQSQYKGIFKKHFLNMASLINISIDEIKSFDMYNGNSLDELKKNTSYMNKDVDYILSNLDNLPPPMFLFKNNELKILGGRTRTSILRIIGKNDIEAYVIDYEKMLPFFSKIREQSILENGFGIFAIENNPLLNSSLLSAARDIRDGIEPNLKRIKRRMNILEESDEEIKTTINELSLYLYGNLSKIEPQILNISIEESKELVEKYSNNIDSTIQKIKN